MSKPRKWNRNIQALPALNHTNFSKYPPMDNCFFSEETSSKKGNLFGELLEQKFSHELESGPAEGVSLPLNKSQWILNKISTLKEDVDTESINSGLSEIKLIASLSSSPSWSDDNDGCKRVQDELEHMDRILRGIDPIPLHYDMDEYKQWMETFPNLSLFGQKDYGPYKISKNIPELDSSYNSGLEEETAFTKTNEMKNLKQYKEEIKKAVIYNIYENLSTRLNTEMYCRTSASKMQKTPRANNSSKTRSYLNDCLQNSPFTCIVQDRYKRNFSNSKYNSLEDEVGLSPRFESLPLMFENPCKNIDLSFNKYKNDSLNANMRKTRRSIILPPIENNKVISSNQIRSISATPTYSSLLSAKAIKLEKKSFDGKSRNIH